MPDQADSLEKLDLSALLREILQDSGTLVGQHVELLRAEVMQEVRRAGGAAALMAAGGGLAMAGGLLSGIMLAHLIHRETKLPLWVCYGIVGGGVSAAALALLQEGRERLSQVQLLPPPETTNALMEDAKWLKEKLTPGNP
jgi:hypothetical protein